MKFARIIGFSILISNLSIAGMAQDIDVPPELDADVRFWELVFGRYSSQECLIHDHDNLSIIYGVRRIARSGRRRDLDIEKAKVAITDGLGSIAKSGVPRSSLEKQIWQQLPKHLRNTEFLREARERVRCQVGVADNFKESLRRSQRFLPVIKSEAKRLGLPEDVAYLPHLESGFHPKAHSKVGARGLWQLMPADARSLRLRVRGRVDDRLDPYLATRAALTKLRKNHELVKSWPLALTGYNYGINGVLRGVRKHETNDYLLIRRKHRSPSFGFASRNFFPSFVAARNLALRYEASLRAEN